MSLFFWLKQKRELWCVRHVVQSAETGQFLGSSTSVIAATNKYKARRVARKNEQQLIGERQTTVVIKTTLTQPEWLVFC